MRSAPLGLLVSLACLALPAVGCTRSGFHVGADASRDGLVDGARDVGVGEATLAPDAFVRPTLSCVELGEVGTASVTINEPGISSDGQRLFAHGDGDKQYVSTRVGNGGVWSAWVETTAVPGWAQDASFIEIDGVEHLFAARSPDVGDDRTLWVCVGPFVEGGATPCQQLVVTDRVTGAVITDDLDGPSAATIDGELVLTISAQVRPKQQILIARPATPGVIVSWRAERLQGGALDGDDPVLSDDGALLVVPDAGLRLWHRDPAGLYTSGATLKIADFAPSGAEVYRRGDAAYELFYSRLVAQPTGPKQDRAFSMLCRP